MIFAIRIFIFSLTLFSFNPIILNINGFVTGVPKSIRFAGMYARSRHGRSLEDHQNNITVSEKSIVRPTPKIVEASSIVNYVVPPEEITPQKKLGVESKTNNSIEKHVLQMEDEFSEKKISVEVRNSTHSEKNDETGMTNNDDSNIQMKGKKSFYEDPSTERKECMSLETGIAVGENHNINISSKVIDADIVESIPSNSEKDIDIWETSNVVPIQGDSLRTCSLDKSINRVQVYMKTEGRPLNANIELWHGPNHIPQTIKVFVEDGSERTFRAILETPRGPNALSIRNTADLEFPCSAILEPDAIIDVDDFYGSTIKKMEAKTVQKEVQGGATLTTPFSYSVSSVKVILQTYGRPLKAKIELLQGPNQRKQTMEVYQENGKERPLYTIIETPGTGNIIRIVNTATIEFPLIARLEAFTMDHYDRETLPDDPSNITWS